MNTTPSIVIDPFDRSHLDALVECVTAVWTTDNVIARALGVTDDDYRPVARRICEQALADDLGLMLREAEADRVVGFYTAIDLVDELIEEENKRAGDNPRMSRWAALLAQGLQWYLDTYHREQPPRRGEVVYFNIGGTIREYRERRWIDRMTTIATSEWVFGRHYRRVLSIATHPHSVHKARTLPIPKHLHELTFADQDEPDLRRITDPPAALVGVFGDVSVSRPGPA
ncbi:MAG: hypothetical protein KDK70_20460 [Myxococcales bacterium]|nr:hypothetical protein [Myxococcales bacterium]